MGGRGEVPSWRAVVLFCLLAAVCPLLLVLSQALRFDVSLLLGPCTVALWALVAAVGLACVIACVGGGLWKRACVAAVLPVVTLVAAHNFGRVWDSSMVLGDRLHFTFVRERYLAEVARLPQPRGERVVFFKWGTLWIFGQGVVYDESDELRLPAPARSEAWRRRAAGTEVAAVTGSTPLGEHFYLVGTE